MKAENLRSKYPTFVYKEYAYELQRRDLHISFDFELGDIKFRPKVVVKNVSAADLKRVGKSATENLIFHLGLAEMPSYWKATVSPKIIIEAGYLDNQQIRWWHDLFMNGMGQYFYENKIDFTKSKFLTIASYPNSSDRINHGTLYAKELKSKTLVPIGGGKDAVITLELLKKAKQELRGFVLNPKREQIDILKIARQRNPVEVKRIIDPKLLELNRKRYLNGHTPFSSYLAFITVLCGVLLDYKYIALSNERSSNEGNIEYLSKVINHQYSKSFDFEKKFRAYSKRYLAKNIEYFSFLRPLYELQIANLFTQYPKYFATFLSCNEAHKTHSGTSKPTGKWCCICSKCLFVFTTLYPFVERETLVKIFGSNLFENKSLIPIMEELVGERRFKPFECVGTTEESLVAFYLSLQKDAGTPPILLQHFRQYILPKHKNIAAIARRILTSRDWKNFVPPHLEKTPENVLE